jgi:hypothetical protein
VKVKIRKAPKRLAMDLEHLLAVLVREANFLAV